MEHRQSGRTRHGLGVLPPLRVDKTRQTRSVRAYDFQRRETDGKTAIGPLTQIERLMMEAPSLPQHLAEGSGPVLHRPPSCRAARR